VALPGPFERAGGNALASNTGGEQTAMTILETTTLEKAMKRPSLWVLLVVLAAAGPTAHAHHSIAAVYDDFQKVTIEGVVTKFEFIHPHPLVMLEVRDRRSGHAHNWRLEMDNRGELAELGFRNDTLKPGDRVVVLGSPARRQPLSLYIRRLERPADGFTYQPPF
jgi:hypothetical protein